MPGSRRAIRSRTGPSSRPTRPPCARPLYNVQAVVLPRKVVVTREFLDFAPVLQAVARMHVGTDNTDLEACRERKVRVIQATTRQRALQRRIPAGQPAAAVSAAASASSLLGERHAPDIRWAASSTAAPSASSGWRPRPTPWR